MVVGYGTPETQLAEDQCRAINLGYMDPDAIRLEDYKHKTDEGVPCVEHAGEILYPLKG